MGDTREDILRLKSQLEAVAPAWLGSLVPVSYSYIKNAPCSEMLFARGYVVGSDEARTASYRNFRDLGARPTLLSRATIAASSPLQENVLLETSYTVRTPYSLPDIHVLVIRNKRLWARINTLIPMLVNQYDANIALGKSPDACKTSMDLATIEYLSEH